MSAEIGWIREQLKALDPEARARALDLLLARWGAGDLACQPERPVVNMHAHTFYSYNGYGHSPTSLVWLAREAGWHALGTVDFDVLDGVDETLQAADRARVRAAAGMETRAFVPEFATREINSPGEQGVIYHIGMGFTSSVAPQVAQEALAQMRQRAAERNRDVVARTNAYLDPVAIDYDRDVLPLTPAGNATERHILVAYDAEARRQYPGRQVLLDFWAGKLEVALSTVAGALGDTPGPNELIRSKLMKRGGVGYVQPGPESFPPVAEVNRAVIACGAIPVCAWLDGTSEGEQHMEDLLDLLIDQGVAALTIIPERNWNLADPAARELKVRNLYATMDLARSLDLPIIAGTEMNKAGQPVLDDFDAEPLRPLRKDLVAGGDFIYGHTLMSRALGIGYYSEWAKQQLPSRRERNAFYTTVGQLVPPDLESRARVARLQRSHGPAALLADIERMWPAAAR